MARLLRDLIEAKEPVFSLKLRAMEAATDNNKIDINLVSDIMAVTARHVRELQLDPEDTTGGELHAALKELALKHDTELSKTGGDIEGLLKKLNSKAPTTTTPVIKASSLKKVIAAMPPKKVMSAMGYRSEASMLKRAPLEQLLLGSFLLESVTWHRKFAKKLKSLTPSDVTMERPRAVIIHPKLMKNARYTHVLSLQCAGLVGVPPYKVKRGVFILTAAVASEALYHMHVRGILLKLRRFENDGVKNITDFTYAAPSPVGEIAKVSVPWISVYGLVADNLGIIGDGPEASVEPQDFVWQAPEQALVKLSSRLDFWSDCHFLARRYDQTVSFNISDIAHSAYNLLPLSHAYRGAFIRGINSEIMKRYLEKAAVQKKIMKKVGLS